MVDLKSKPFNLNDEQIKWVKKQIEEMTIEEKIGQLFANLFPFRTEESLKEAVNKYHISTARYNNASKEEILEQNKILQKYSKIPLFIACNTEGGGDGACNDGTPVGYPVKVGATGDKKYGYLMGKVCGVEAEAIGCNMLFSPIVDINYNWRNPIISKRCFGSDPDTVLEFSKEYFRGVHENTKSVACCIKHFPGDGVDERDQHLSNSVNTFSVEEWDNTFGKVYKGMIDEGVEAIMAGHILLPSYTKFFNKNIKDEDIEPATLSKELLTNLLREKLGFNGIIYTDASHMVGMTSRDKRRYILPKAIEAGCDQFLFFNDMDEDFEYMLEGYKNGILSDKRLNEALERVLGLKARMGLTKSFELVGDLEKVGSEEHIKIAQEIAEKSITLVKNKDNIFPISKDKYKRIMIVPANGLSGPNIFKLIMPDNHKKKPEELLRDLLIEEGFDAFIYESPLLMLERAKTPEEKAKFGNAYFAGKSAIKDFVSKQDLVITFMNVATYGQNVERVGWGMSKGGGEIPWYIHELPVVVLSVGSPFCLIDVPYARTYVNAFANNKYCIRAFVNKFVGRTKFEGINNIDPFCGKWDTRN